MAIIRGWQLCKLPLLPTSPPHVHREGEGGLGFSWEGGVLMILKAMGSLAGHWPFIIWSAKSLSIYCYAEKILIQTFCGKKDVGDGVPEAKNRILSGSASAEDRQIDVNRAIPSRKEVRPFFKNIFLAKRDFFVESEPWGLKLEHKVHRCVTRTWPQSVRLLRPNLHRDVHPCRRLMRWHLRISRQSI